MNCSKCGLPIAFAECDPSTTAVQHTVCPTRTPSPSSGEIVNPAESHYHNPQPNASLDEVAEQIASNVWKYCGYAWPEANREGFQDKIKEIIKLALQEREGQLSEELAKLQDPTAVWVNILHGKIKIPEFLKDCRSLQQHCDTLRADNERLEGVNERHKEFQNEVRHIIGCADADRSIIWTALNSRMNRLTTLQSQVERMKEALETSNEQLRFFAVHHNALTSGQRIDLVKLCDNNTFALSTLPPVGIGDKERLDWLDKHRATCSEGWRIIHDYTDPDPSKESGIRQAIDAAIKQETMK